MAVVSSSDAPKQCLIVFKKWSLFPISLALGLSAAGVVNDQHNINAVHFQEVHKETSIPLGIQTHASRVVSCQRLVLAGWHFHQGLKYPVVLLHEKPVG